MKHTQKGQCECKSYKMKHMIKKMSLFRPQRTLKRKRGFFFYIIQSDKHIYIKDSADTKWTSGFYLKLPFHFSQYNNAV